MAKANLYDIDGKLKGSVKLPTYFDEKMNIDLLSQAIYVFQDRRHPGLAKAKTRGDVKISTRKIYRQKGTGGARHGAKSAPIFVGGGVTHGPKGFKRILKLNKNLKRKALKITMAIKAFQGKVYLVDGIEKATKTSQIDKFLNAVFGNKKILNVIFALSDKSGRAQQAIRNITGVKVQNYRNLNALDIYLAGDLVIDNAVFAKKLVKKAIEIKSKKVEK